MSRQLPFDCPRGLNRVEAARYVGVSPNTLDKLILEGRMPRAKRIGTRRIFDRQALDVAFSALGEDGHEANDFDGA
ncbi:hypothetical protein U91I_01195 [alpha proteobacterium U9-1i]|nr:hypothetical protein U91I_01195 [alpha proteobacterium U9-1i]